MEQKLDNFEPLDPDFEAMLYARHVEIESMEDLKIQRGTAIPALFNSFHKFVQNPSSVSVETFKRMVDTDDTVGSGVDFLTTCLSARMGRYLHESEEITEWVNKALAQIDGGFQPALKELLSATWAGFAVQEKVWANTDMGWVVKKLISLPPSTVLFETERTGELTSDGILQYQRNYNPAFAAGGVSYLFGFGMNATAVPANYKPDPYAKLGDFPFPLRTANTYSYLSIRIPKDKCIHYAFDAQGKFGNVYGRSLLRRAYKFYVTKDAVLQMLATALDRKGTPLTLVYADPNAPISNNNLTGEVGNQRGVRNKGIRADLAARDAFRNIHNDSTIVLPGKKDQVYSVEALTQGSNSGDFLETLRFCNQSIMRSLLIPSLIFTNGDGTGSFALGQEHAKTFDKILDGMLAGLTDTLVQQLIKPMIQFNFPEAAYKEAGFGDFAKRQLAQDEIDKELETIERAVSIGAIDMTDLNDLNLVREKMGFEAKQEPMGGLGETPEQSELPEMRTDTE